MANNLRVGYVQYGEVHLSGKSDPITFGVSFTDDSDTDTHTGFKSFDLAKQAVNEKNVLEYIYKDDYLNDRFWQVVKERNGLFFGTDDTGVRQWHSLESLGYDKDMEEE